MPLFFFIHLLVDLDRCKIRKRRRLASIQLLIFPVFLVCLTTILRSERIKSLDSFLRKINYSSFFDNYAWIFPTEDTLTSGFIYFLFIEYAKTIFKLKRKNNASPFKKNIFFRKMGFSKMFNIFQ